MKSFRNQVDNQVRFSIDPQGLCPCRSGEPVSNCCLTQNGLHKKSRTISTPGQKTNRSILGCYASSLSDCGKKLSREHFISENLLRLLNSNDRLAVGGFPWARDGLKNVSPNSLASKVLCERHNTALSPLDVQATLFFDAFQVRRNNSNIQSSIYLLSGHDVERWLLKTLCGIIASQNFPNALGEKVAIPAYWMEILFLGADFPDEQGLYVCNSKGHIFEGPSRGIQFRTISATSGNFSGLGLWFCGYELILSMSGFPSRHFDGRNVAYRPLEIYTVGPQFERSVAFSWKGNADLGTITVNVE